MFMITLACPQLLQLTVITLKLLNDQTESKELIDNFLLKIKLNRIQEQEDHSKNVFSIFSFLNL